MRSSSATRRPQTAKSSERVVPPHFWTITDGHISVHRRQPDTSHQLLGAAEGHRGASLQAKRSDHGLLRIGASQPQRPTDVLSVDDLLDEPAVERRRRC